MIMLARQTVWGRKRTFVSPFIALTMAAALVTAAGVLVESGIRGSAAPDRYAGAYIVVAASQRMDDPVQPTETVHLPERVRIPGDLASSLEGLPGVEAVHLDRTLPVTVAVGGLLLSADDRAVLGHGWSSASLLGDIDSEGAAPGAPNEVVLDRELARNGVVGVGDEVTITSTDGTHSYRVVGLVATQDDAARRNAPVYFTDDVARGLSIAPGLVDAIGVIVADGADIDDVAAAIRNELPLGVDVLTGRARARPETLDAALQNRELVEFGGAFGGTAAMLAVFVVAATLGLSILQRSREIALLRAVGATPFQVRRMIVGEAAVVALVAGIAGAIPGVLLGTALFNVLRAAGITADTTQLRLGVVPIAVAIAAGLIAASLAALLAGRRTGRIRPTAALSEAAIESPRIGWFRLFFGILLVGGGLALSVLAGTLEGEQGASATVGVLLTLIIGIAVLGPVLAHGAGMIGGPIVAAISRTSGFLAMANLQTRSRRLASASTPLALAVALTLTMVGSLTTEAAATERQTRDRLIADRTLIAPGGLSPGFAELVQGMPGVAAAVEVFPTTVGADRAELFGERVFELRPAVGVSAPGVESVLDLNVLDGSLDDLGPGSVALSTELARSTGTEIGDELQLWLGDGTRLTVTAVAIYERSLGLGDFVLPREVVLPHLTTPMADQVLVAFEDAAASHQVDAALALLQEQTPGLQVLDRVAVQLEHARAVDEGMSVNYLFVGVLAAFVTVAMVNSLVLATAERARELALLRLVGATPAQVLWMVRCESIVVVAFGGVLGLVVAAATLVPFSLGIADTWVPSVPPLFIAIVVAGAVVLGVGATELAARSVLRKDPVEVISAVA